MDWTKLYPSTAITTKKVEIVDIGCGFGGLLFALASRLPDTLILGMLIAIFRSQHQMDSLLIYIIYRNGTSHVCYRFCCGQNQSHEESESRNTTLQEYQLPSSQ